jgi:hypothetical protein
VLAFIVFVRAKNRYLHLLTNPERDLLRYELSVLDEREAQHLELELADYQSLYAHE